MTLPEALSGLLLASSVVPKCPGVRGFVASEVPGEVHGEAFSGTQEQHDVGAGTHEGAGADEKEHSAAEERLKRTKKERGWID